MARYQQERQGQNLKVLKRDVEFSFWPMGRGNRRYGLQSRIFATDPWNVMERSVYGKCSGNDQRLALAFLEQARDFFAAANFGGIRPAKPLLLYYSFMNLVKAFALTNGLENDFEKSRHGLSPTFPIPGQNLLAGSIRCYPTRRPGQNDHVNVFDLLLKGIRGTGLPEIESVDLGHVMPQIVLSHRLWCYAAGRKERFVEVDRIKFGDHRQSKRCWLYFDLVKSEFSRLGYTHQALFDGARLGGHWQRVTPVIKEDAGRYFRLELRQPIRYNSRPSDVINSMVSSVRQDFWRSITITRPFRKYYTYVSDPGDKIFPQICSIYLLMFYLGSITRYHPDHFDDIVASPFGAFINEFIENQPNQWLYMLASEFAEQEITRAAVV